jgi:hypothetical protein
LAKAGIGLAFGHLGQNGSKKSKLNLRPGSPITPPMLAKVCSAAVNGIEAYPVEVEVHAGFGDTIIVLVVTFSPE